MIERRGRSWSRTLGSQPAGDSMHSHEPGGGLPPPPTKAHSDTHAYHKPGGRLPLLSARPAVTFPAVRHHRPQASTELYCLVTEAHRCEKLAESFCTMVLGRDSNPRPLDRESDTLPRHHDAMVLQVDKNGYIWPRSLIFRANIDSNMQRLFSRVDTVDIGVCRVCVCVCLGTCYPWYIPRLSFATTICRKVYLSFLNFRCQIWRECLCNCLIYPRSWHCFRLSLRAKFSLYKADH